MVTLQDVRVAMRHVKTDLPEDTVTNAGTGSKKQ